MRKEKSSFIEGFGGGGAGMSSVCVEGFTESGSLHVEVVGELIAVSMSNSVEPRMAVVNVEEEEEEEED